MCMCVCAHTEEPKRRLKNKASPGERKRKANPTIAVCIVFIWLLWYDTGVQSQYQAKERFARHLGVAISKMSNEITITCNNQTCIKTRRGKTIAACASITITTSTFIFDFLTEIHWEVNNLFCSLSMLLLHSFYLYLGFDFYFCWHHAATSLSLLLESADNKSSSITFPSIFIRFTLFYFFSFSFVSEFAVRKIAKIKKICEKAMKRRIKTKRRENPLVRRRCSTKVWGGNRFSLNKNDFCFVYFSFISRWIGIYFIRQSIEYTFFCMKLHYTVQCISLYVYNLFLCWNCVFIFGISLLCCSRCMRLITMISEHNKSRLHFFPVRATLFFFVVVQIEIEFLQCTQHRTLCENYLQFTIL